MGYEPELVIVSAGFDSAAGDEEGYLVSPKGYAYLLSQLTKLASGRVVVVLEGGYNIPAISHGLHACAATLLQAVDELPSEDSNEGHEGNEGVRRSTVCQWQFQCACRPTCFR